VILGAESQVGTLVGCFLAALVIVSPFAYRQVRKVQRARVALRPAIPVDEEVVPTADDADLVATVGRITADAAARDPGVEFAVDLPSHATLGGRPADRLIVESIIADGLRRDGIEILARDGDTWRCRRTG
jgi:hypothetical protein